MNKKDNNIPNSSRRRLRGIVVKKSGDKTVAVEVVRSLRHPMYHKSSKWTKRYLAHDEVNQAVVGQQVEIAESRPMSRRKRWILVSVLNQEAADKK